MTSKLVKGAYSKIDRLYALIASMLISFMVSNVAFAAGDDLETVITNALKSITTIISSVFNPICVVALGICIVILVIGRNSKSAESSMSWAKRIVICFIAFNVMGTVLTWLSGLGSGQKLTEFTGTGFIQLINAYPLF